MTVHTLSYHVLCVDDEVFLLGLCRIFLEKTGNFRVDMAESAGEALKMLESGNYDAIISDYEMPGMNGIEFLKKVRESENTIPFIIFTGKGREEVVIEALNNGADFYLQKGGDPKAQFAELTSKINHAIRKEQAEQELKHQISELVKSEERLRESEERYRSVVENTQDVFYRSDMEGNLLLASPSILPLFGYDSLDEIIGKNIAKTFYQDPSERKRFLRALDENGSVYNYETVLLKKDKTPVYASTNSHYYYHKDGSLAGVEGNIRDITRLKEISTALRESEQLYRVLVEHTQDGVFILQDENIVFCNRSLADLAGYNRDEVIGRSFFDFIAPEDREEVIWSYNRRLSGELLPDSYEIRVLHKDQVTRIQVMMSVGIGDYKGKIATIGTLRNSTHEYEQTELSLRQSRAMLNSILQESPICQFVIDTSHRVIYWNHALEEYSRIPASEMVGTRNHWRAFYPDTRPCLVDLMIDGNSEAVERWYKGKAVKSRLVENAYSSTDFFPSIGEDGTWLFFTGALLRDAEGKVWGALETLEDISEQKMSVEGLRLANQKLNLLSDITRHDILNSLTVLTGSIDLIREESRDPDQVAYIDTAEKALDSIRRQITFTRDYQNLGVTAPVWQNLSQVIQESIIPQIPPGITFSEENTRIEIFADALLGRAFSNLLDNSLRHGENVTKIGVSVSMEGDSAKIWYSDNGKGIPDAMKEKIFEQGVGSHTGFGLFLIREILSISQITIREIGRLGGGAVFEMTVPSRFFRYQA